MSLEKFVRKHQDYFDDKVMPERASLDFEARLKNELHSKDTRVKRLKIKRYLSIAASIAFLVALGFWYQNRHKHITIRDNLILALDESNTNSSRLQVIYDINEQLANDAEDERILDAFFKILHGDSNANSKIAVIEALLKIPSNTTVRNNLLDALANETEPLVQLKLIKSIALLREQRAKESLEKIIENERSLPLVKGNASALLAMLNQ